MFQSRRALVGAGLLLLTLAGCGYNPDKPVYDTTLNPDGFPQDAVAVLYEIEVDSLSGYAAITDAFGTLYSAQPELLDNKDWQIVIHRLGASFRYKADKLVAQGFSNYSTAAGLYTLAAYARPNDTRSTDQRDLFEVWERATEDSLIPDTLFQQGKGPGLVTRLKLAKAFVFGDSVSGVFASRYLIPPLFYSNPQFNLLNVKVLDGLSNPDRAFASYLGLVQKPGRTRLAAFASPSIDLLAAEIIPAGPGEWRAAFYFVPRQKIDSDLTVAFRLKVDNSATPGTGDIPLDFRPATPTSRWRSGKVAVAFRKFQYGGSPVDVFVGLFDNAVAHPRFVELEGTVAEMHRLPSSVFGRR
jgi:hypothetical protein